jgi:hypothetical protein
MSRYKVEISAYLNEIFEGEDIDEVETRVKHDPEIGVNYAPLTQGASCFIGNTCVIFRI